METGLRRGLLQVEDEDTYMLKRAFELRYQVYCLERKYLPASDFPHGFETDEHDKEAAHFGVFDDEEELVGYVRLVLPKDGGFPYQRYCTTLHDGEPLPHTTSAAEISRLVVREDRRRWIRSGLQGRRREDAGGPDAVLQHHSESTRILMQLYRQMYAYSIEKGIRYWYAAMERSLARSLTYTNFAFRKIGPETDYFGPVSPYIAELRELGQNVAATNPQLWAWMKGAEVPPQADVAEWQSLNLRTPVQRRSRDLRPVVTPRSAAMSMDYMRAPPPQASA